MTARWNEPDLDTWNGETWVPCTHELKIMQPKPPGKSYLQAGYAYGGSSWRELFKKAHADISQHGTPTAYLDKQGRLILNNNPSAKSN